jgi:hypothetical protein
MSRRSSSHGGIRTEDSKMQTFLVGLCQECGKLKKNEKAAQNHFILLAGALNSGTIT